VHTPDDQLFIRAQSTTVEVRVVHCKRAEASHLGHVEVDSLVIY